MNSGFERQWKASKTQTKVCVLQARIDTPQGQLEVKDRQTEQQTQTITQLTDALAAAQALHARTIQRQLLASEAEANWQHREPSKKVGWFQKLFGRCLLYHIDKRGISSYNSILFDYIEL